MRVAIFEGVTVNAFRKQVAQIQFTGCFVQMIPEVQKQILKAAAPTIGGDQFSQRLHFCICQFDSQVSG